MSKSFQKITSNFVFVSEENIDTDQILPARFLTTTERKGMGNYLFYDWRFDANGHEKPLSAFNKTTAKTAQILVAGANFACGSSREHAPWGLVDFGFRAVLSTEFADIFKNNAVKNSLLPIQIDTQFFNWLQKNQDADITIDLKNKQVLYGDSQSYEFTIDSFAHHRLLNGIDEMEFLLSHANQIKSFEENNDRV